MLLGVIPMIYDIGMLLGVIPMIYFGILKILEEKSQKGVN